VVLHLLGVPAAADAEMKRPLEIRSSEATCLGGLDRVALDTRHTPGPTLSRLVTAAAALVSRRVHYVEILRPSSPVCRAAKTAG